MNKIRVWIVILAFLFSLALTGTVLAATPEQNPPPTGFSQQVEENGDINSTVEGVGTDTVGTLYTFSQYTGTYTTIVSGTVHGTASNDDNNFNAIDIGFPFYFDGLEYTQISIQSNGFVAMGASVVSSYTPLSTGSTNNVVAALGRDIEGNDTTSTLISNLEGTAPNRVFVIQWSHYRRYGTTYTGDDFNFQIRLYETSDVVEIVYGPFAFHDTVTLTPQVGLRGASNADFNNRTTTTNWTASTAGITNADTMSLSSVVFPPSGLTFVWTASPFVSLGPDYAGSVCRGGDVVYPLTAINYTLAADTLVNTFAGNTWPTDVTPASLALGPKESGIITATVHIPWATAPGDQDQTIVTTTGQLSGMSDNAYLNTTSSLIGGYTDYANVPVGREVRAPGVVHWGGKLYKIGGYGYIGATGAARAWLDIYDIATNTWTSGADMPGARYWIDCEAIDLTGTDPKIYCGGGYLTSGMNTLYIYDINTNTWTTGATLPANRYNAASVVYNNKYYMIGGYLTAVTSTMIVYDPATNTWDSTLASMVTARRYTHAGLIGGKIYVAGGYSTTYLSSAEVYDIGTNSWSPIASLPTTWVNAADAVKSDRYLLLFGGHPSSTSGASNGALIYDSLTDTWSWLPNIDHLLYGAEAEVDASGNIWIVSGRMYENAVWSNSPYTSLVDECTACVPVTGADFTVNPNIPRPNLPATFTASVAGGSPALVYNWDFGDGTFGTGAVVQHTFAAAGTYTVVLTVSNCDGASTSTEVKSVLVEAGPLANIFPTLLEATQCPDCQTEQVINVCNEGDTPLLWNVTEDAGLPINMSGGIDSLSGSFVVFDPSAGGDPGLVPGTNQTFCFRAESFTNDWEYRYDLWMKFPTDWTVSNAYVVGTPVCDSGANWDPFAYYYETAPYEIWIQHRAYMNTVDHCVATYCVDVTSGVTAPTAPVSWYWSGDGYGGTPHHPCSLDGYTPPSMAGTPCDEAVNPQAYIPDTSAIPWISETPLAGSVDPGVCEVITVTFDSTGLAPGVFTGTLDITTNDIENLEVPVPVTLTVAGPPINVGFNFNPASPIIGQDITFNGFADALQPVDFVWDFGDGITATGQTPTHAYADFGTYTVTMTANECNFSEVVVSTVTVLPCYSLVNENFESTFPPLDWTVLNNGGTCVWQRNDQVPSGRPNYAGGDGFAADADSDRCGSGTTMDTELRTMSLDLTGVHTATLQYMTAYNDIGTGGDFADVDVSLDGGGTWANLLHWDADHSPSGPGELVNLDLTSYAGYSNVMVRYHYYLATYDWWWEVDQVNLVGCIVPGAQPDIVVTPLDLTQELQTNQTADQTFNIANVGLEWLTWNVDVGCGTPVGWLSAAPLTGTLSAYSNTDVTATFDSTGLALGTYQAPICVNSNDPDSPTVSINATLVVTGTPDIEVTLPVLDATLPPDATTTLDGTICNVGDGTLNWTLSELPASLLDAQAPAVQPKPQPEIVRLPDGSVDCAAYQDYVGYEPAEVAAACPASLPAQVTSSPQAPTDIGYAQDIGYISDNFVSFTLNNFSGQTVIGSNATPYYGVDFDPAGEVLYALNDTTDMLGTIDLTTGAFTPLVSCPPGGGAANWTGLTIDPVTGVFYGSTATSLFIIDPATGSSTLVGSYGTTLMIAIAINMDGQMYGHDIGTDSIYSIDPATGVATLIGLTGYAANYAQGMDFDNQDGTLYIFLYVGSGANVYGTVNLATGAVTPLSVDSPLGEFEGATQTAGFTDIPWLSETPLSGTLQPGECINEYVTFDSAGLTVGSYYGNLRIESDDPDEGEIILPVTLTVIPTVDFVYYDLEDVVLPGEAVYLTGDFAGWVPDALQMTPNGDSSVFSLSVPLEMGIHEYKYVVYTDTVPSGPAHWDWLQSYPDGHNRQVDVTGDMTVEDYRDIVPGWWVLQWPPAITTTVHIPTEWIYGQIWAWGYTTEPGEPRALLAELGYGTEVDPSAWPTWFSIPWVSQEGDNDQYADSILPEETGVYSYAVRYNGNWGVGNPNNFWYYGDTNGNDYNPSEAGVLTVIGPSIELVKTVGTDPDVCATTDSLDVLVGTEVYYCFTVTNTSLIQLNIHDLVDDQLGDLLVDFDYGLPPGESTFITASLVATVDVVNTATWTAGDGDTHFAEASDSATVTVFAAQADLSLSKTGPVSVETGETFTYTLTVENLGPQAAVDVVLVDTLPAGVIVVSLPEACSEVEGVVTCLLGGMPVDSMSVIEIVVTAPGATGTITNVAVVSAGTLDPVDTNNSASIDTLVEVGFYYTYLSLVFKH